MKIVGALVARPSYLLLLAFGSDDVIVTASYAFGAQLAVRSFQSQLALRLRIEVAIGAGVSSCVECLSLHFCSLLCFPESRKNACQQPVTKRTTMHSFTCRAIHEHKGTGTLLALDNIDDKLLCSLRDTNSCHVFTPQK